MEYDIGRAVQADSESCAARGWITTSTTLASGPAPNATRRACDVRVFLKLFRASVIFCSCPQILLKCEQMDGSGLNKTFKNTLIRAIDSRDGSILNGIFFKPAILPLLERLLYKFMIV